MNNIRTNPKGIDSKIQQLQNAMYPYLCAKWGITDNEYECYGRCYRLDDGQGNYSPAAYTTGIEYQSMVMNDKVKAQSFFDVAETVKVGLDKRNTATIYLLFHIPNLKAIYATDADRCDELVRNDVANFCNTLFGFNLTAIQIGSKKALSEFTGQIKKNQVTLDMQPRHIFRLDFTLANYDTLNNNC